MDLTIWMMWQTVYKVDGSGNVYVTGFVTSSSDGKNYVTRKYNSTGTLQWSKEFDAGSDDEATSLEFDMSGDILVTGASVKLGNQDFVTIKYLASNGTQEWETRFNSDYNDDDIPHNIAIDYDGNIYVIGTIGKGDGTTTYMMCKYSEKIVCVPVPDDSFSLGGGYIANKGQLRDADSTSNTTAKFYNTDYTVATYLENRYVSYQLSQTVDSTDADTTFRVRMDFTKGSTTTKVYPFDTRPEYHNYFLGHMSQPSVRTPIYNSVIRPESYTNTDIIFTHSPSGFRHWIVAKTGAPTSDFEMTFTGQDGLSIESNGDLHIETSIGDIVMTKANAYLINLTTGELTLLGWQPSYSINSSIVSFSGIGSWTGSLVLEFGDELVTPGSAMQVENLEWSTFFGGIGEDRLQGVATDESNYCWVSGYTKSPYFVELGENVGEQYSGNQDAVISVFNDICVPLFHFYYGGSDTDFFL